MILGPTWTIVSKMFPNTKRDQTEQLYVIDPAGFFKIWKIPTRCVVELWWNWPEIPCRPFQQKLEKEKRSCRIFCSHSNSFDRLIPIELTAKTSPSNRATLRVRSCRIRPTVNAIKIQDSIQTWTQSNRPIHWVFLLFGYLFIYFLCVFIKWPTFWCRSWGWRRWWVLRGSRRLFRVHSMQFASNSTASNSS